MVAASALMNLSRFLMNGVSRPCVSWFRTTRPSAKGSTVRAGAGAALPAGLTVTVAFGSNAVPGTLPVTV